MTFEELKRLAAVSAPMPSELNAAEQLAFQSARCMYIQYSLGAIDVKQAEIEMNQIKKQYEINQLTLECCRIQQERAKQMSFLSPELKKSGCEICRKFYNIFTGIEKNEIKEEGNEKQQE